MPWSICLVLGAGHSLRVGVPFIIEKGGGEGLLYILIIDFPLYLLGMWTVTNLMYTSVIFNFFLFVLGGTLMYAFIGYGMGALIKWIIRKN